MTPLKNQRKLRNYFINFGIQRKIIVINLIFMLLVFMLTTAILYTYIIEREMGETGLWHFGIGNLTMSLSSKLFILYGALVCTFILAITTQVWMTHRVCGAIINFSNTFKKIRGGDLEKRIHLRKHDLLLNEAEGFNEMMEVVAQIITALRKENHELHSALKKIP